MLEKEIAPTAAMRRALLVLIALTIAYFAPCVKGETNIATVTVDCWNSAMCPTPGRDGVTTNYFCYFGKVTCSFTDPLPFGSTITNITATPWLVRAASSTQGMGANVYINNEMIGNQRVFTNRTVCGSGAFQPYPDVGPATAYRYGADNDLTVELIQTDMGHGCVELVQLDIEYELPPPIAFNITDETPAADRRVLLSNTSRSIGGGPNYPYPQYQNLLARDAAFPVTVRVRDASGEGLPNVVVKLRIVDPADSSPYVAGGTGVVLPVPGAQPNDNFGVTPTLAGQGLSTNGDGIYTATSGANGLIETTLEFGGTGAAAGDNWKVEATIVQADGTPYTATSGEITVWKRMFVEKRSMYRRGAPLATDAPAGTQTIVVRDQPIATTGISAFARNEFIMLMHAPLFGEPKQSGSFYTDTFQITARPQRFRAQAVATGAGTITTDGTNTIVGVGTRFRRLAVGDVLTIAGASGTGEQLRIVSIPNDTHAVVHRIPSITAVGQPYTIGDPALAVGTNYLRLVLDRPLTRDYRRDPIRNDPTQLFLNDAVIRLGATASASAEIFDVNDSRLSGSTVPPWTEAFPAAYVEYIVLPPPSSMPAVPRMLLSRFTEEAMLYIDKWFALPQPTANAGGSGTDAYKYVTPGNHQLLLVGDTEPDGPAKFGANGFAVYQRTGERSSILNRATVEHHVNLSGSPLYRADPDVVLQRTMVHEIVHQWQSNYAFFLPSTTYMDHCHPRVAYDSAVGYPNNNGTPPAGLKFCLMSWADGGPTMPDPYNKQGQPISMIQYLYRNGWTTLHIDNRPHSEYLEIRQHTDPWTP